MASSAKYIRERRRGLFRQNTFRKNALWAKNNERKTDSGQNRLEKGVEVAAKYITKKCIPGKI